jgi:hypothetical protein
MLPDTVSELYLIVPDSFGPFAFQRQVRLVGTLDKFGSRRNVRQILKCFADLIDVGFRITDDEACTDAAVCKLTQKRILIMVPVRNEPIPDMSDSEVVECCGDALVVSVRRIRVRRVNVDADGRNEVVDGSCLDRLDRALGVWGYDRDHTTRLVRTCQ